MILPGFPDAQPVEGLVGGLMIGASAAIMLLALGRIAGVSGLFARAIRIEASATPWAIAALFVAGLVIGGALFAGIAGPIKAHYPPGFGWLIAGGLMVGFGTRLGSGCTSGHGVCGIARLSPRSLAATGLFMATAALTVFVTRHLTGMI